MNLSPEQLEKLQTATVAALIARIESGEASHQELEVARKMLHDNGVFIDPRELGKGGGPKPLPDLKEMPFQAEEQDRRTG